MIRILLLSTVICLVGCNRDKVESVSRGDPPNTVVNNVAPQDTSTDQGTTGCYIHTPWTDFASDADADKDSYRKLTPDELAFFRAIATFNNGWDGYPVGDSAFLDHHISKTDPKNPHSVWTVAFVDGTQVCSTMKVGADTIKLLSEIYVDAAETR